MPNSWASLTLYRAIIGFLVIEFCRVNLISFFWKLFSINLISIFAHSIGRKSSIQAILLFLKQSRVIWHSKFAFIFIANPNLTDLILKIFNRKFLRPFCLKIFIFIIMLLLDWSFSLSTVEKSSDWCFWIHFYFLL